MGMFDDITVPKSYLRGLLTKDQEKLIVDNDYQTKSLENFLAQYKVHRQKLYIREGLKKGRINAGGPFNKALAEFYRNSLDNRKVAIMAYKEINRVDVIDFNNTKVLTELTGIIKSNESSLEKMKQRILKNLPK